LDNIRELKREQEIPHEGLMCDILWCDPGDRSGWDFFGRSATFDFGADVTQQFLHSHGLSFMARAHQLVMEGFAWMHHQHLVTIFSAPNYCGRCGNDAAVMVIDEHQDHEFQSFGPKKQ
jgi:serine/threonine-protein phosphatase 2A catalytic subunit